MAEFLTTAREVMSHIEKIIIDAKPKSSVVLVSPYIDFSSNIFERLQDADGRNVQICLVLRKGQETKPENRDELEKLQELKHLKLHLRERLHAKCYYNEEHMVITSMNLYEYSEKNREMGILIHKIADSKIFHNAVKEVETIIGSSTKGDVKRILDDSPHSTQRQTKGRVGFCIRCARPIAADPGKPYCPDCFRVWDEYENPEYEEQSCHLCGRPWHSTMARPLCDSCYRRMGR